MYYRGDGGGTSVHLVLRSPTSCSHATSLDTRTHVSFLVCYRQHSHMHVYIETGTCTQATPLSRAREEVPRLRNRRDAGEKAMAMLENTSSPRFCLLGARLACERG